MLEKIKLLNPRMHLLLQQISPHINLEHLNSVQNLFYGACCIQKNMNFHPCTDYFESSIINQFHTTRNAIEEILKKQKNITPEDINSVQRFFKNGPYGDNGLGL